MAQTMATATTSMKNTLNIHAIIGRDSSVTRMAVSRRCISSMNSRVPTPRLSRFFMTVNSGGLAKNNNIPSRSHRNIVAIWGCYQSLSFDGRCLSTTTSSTNSNGSGNNVNKQTDGVRNDTASYSTKIDVESMSAPSSSAAAAAAGASAESLDELCKKYMDVPEQEFSMGCSFLHQVALGASIETVDEMVQDMPSLINFRDYDRRTPLHIAASEGHIEICQYLVRKGAMLNRSDRWGGSPLDDSHRHRHTAVCDYLRSVGGRFGSPSQATNFITAAYEGDIDEVRALLEFGSIDINSKDYDKRTALHLASGEGRTDIARLLLLHGADPNTADRWGNRPLDDAKAAQHTDTIKVLEENGAMVGTTIGCTMGKEALIDLMQTYGKVRPTDDGDQVLSLDWHDVSDLLRANGQDPTDDVVKKLFDVADVDHNGYIDTNEFIAHQDLFLGGRPARIILVVGGPGSGKGVLCERLVRECGVVHVSSGELLRREVEEGTELGKQVEGIMKSGGLVSSAIMVALMQKHMRDHPGKRILLDGFPRSLENARDLVALCGKPELALHLECDDTILMERIMKRGASGKRKDDNFETALHRIRTYHKAHDMTLQFLRDEHVPIVNLDCSATAEGVWSQLQSIGRLMRAAVKLNPTTIHGATNGYGSNNNNN
mmetsp:Transcript_58628/g.143368  ORF Transcript_58628/g.143368 Transcript_58628/m.143368 type:complete len:659 (-) Transcript_58628:243-2219(-)